MEQIVEDNREQIVRLCKQFYVSRLDVFGSATTGEFDPETSDLDFLVTFDDSAPRGGFKRPYFGLLMALEDLSQRKIDLVMESAIDNPYFREGVDDTRVPIYGA